MDRTFAPPAGTPTFFCGKKHLDNGDNDNNNINNNENNNNVLNGSYDRTTATNTNFFSGKKQRTLISPTKISFF